MIRSRLALAFCAALLTACSETKTQHVMTVGESDLRLRPFVSSVLVNTMSLPAYAAGDDVALQDKSGAIIASTGALWADQQDRATTLAVARTMGRILDVTAAPEPWPFNDFPDATVDVRVERMLAGHDGVFRLSGLYFVRFEAEDRSAKTGAFDIETTLYTPTPAGIAAAQSRAVRILAERLAGALGR